MKRTPGGQPRQPDEVIREIEDQVRRVRKRIPLEVDERSIPTWLYQDVVAQLAEERRRYRALRKALVAMREHSGPTPRSLYERMEVALMDALRAVEEADPL